MKSKGYSDIKARVPRVGIWCCGKVIHSLRLARGLYPISSMLHYPRGILAQDRQEWRTTVSSAAKEVT